MLNVYDGTVGVFFDKDKLEQELRRYLVNVGDTLSYEVKTGETGVIIITGRNNEEKNIIPFEHPFVFTDVRGRRYVAIDLRAFMKSNLDDMINVTEKLNDKYNGKLQLMRTIFTRLMLDGELDWFRVTRNLIITNFGILLKQFTHLITFDKQLSDRVEYIAKLHEATLDDDNEISLEQAVERLPSKDIANLKHGKEKDLLSLLIKLEQLGKFKLPSRTLGGLVKNIQAVVDNNRAAGLSPDLYTQVLSRSFYSFNSTALAIAMIEHLPTFISVYTMVTTEGINSKSNFRKILNSFKAVLKPKELSETFNRVYNNNLELL